MGKSEDRWAVLIALALVALVLLGLVTDVGKVGTWQSAPLHALQGLAKPGFAVAAVGFVVLNSLAHRALAEAPPTLARLLAGLLVTVLLAVLAKLLGSYAPFKQYGFGYALWALALGLLIANTVGTPHWLEQSARGELFIKTGLVVMGAEILLQRALKLGPPGMIVAFGVTPVVIVFMWTVGTRWLKLPSKALTIVIACSTSVCGVSAAIASAAASGAKKEELSLAVGMTMIFTALMMVGMPLACRALGLSEQVGGAWIGGTVDSTGAVVVSGALLGEQAEQVAAIVKMIQNTMIGGIAFLIALYWVSSVEREASSPRPSIAELWRRFPKFVLGFVLVSLLFSLVLVPLLGMDEVKALTKLTKGLRGWLFSLAFVAIGLSTDFRKLASQLVGGKPIWLYAIGQSFNIALTLLVASLVFEYALSSCAAAEVGGGVHLQVFTPSARRSAYSPTAVPWDPGRDVAL